MNSQTHADTQMPLRITRVYDAAEGIRSFELTQPDGSELPQFTAGSHVKVQAPTGALRKYSLCNDPAERHRYVITVKRDDRGQGGSISMHDDAREGDILPTSLLRAGKPHQLKRVLRHGGQINGLAGDAAQQPVRCSAGLSFSAWVCSDDAAPTMAARGVRRSCDTAARKVL